VRDRQEVKRERGRRGEPAEESGIMGASWRGDRERNCARCVAGAGARDWVEELTRKRKGGDYSITCAPTDLPISLSLGGLSEQQYECNLLTFLGKYYY